MPSYSFLAATLALAATTVSATPLQYQGDAAKRDADTFNIHIHNNCGFDKSFGLYQISGSFEMISMSDTLDIASKDAATMSAPYSESGMRLSGHAEWPIGDQWNAQALFEYGYSTYSTVSGVAYDLSLMEGADSNIGISVVPVPNGSGSYNCPKKLCFPWDCPEDQGWTNEDQVNIGSPADTTCYKGKTDFKVTFCPPS